MRGDVAFSGEGKSMEAGRIRNNLHYSVAYCVVIVKGYGVYEVSGHLVVGTSSPYDWGHTSLGGGDPNLPSHGYLIGKGKAWAVFMHR